MPACVMNWGCNHTETGASDGMCGAMFKRAFMQAKKKIVVDPRRIGLAEKADYWLQLKPGSECALALAMINVIIGEDLYDHEFVEKYGFGFDRLATTSAPSRPNGRSPVTQHPSFHDKRRRPGLLRRRSPHASSGATGSTRARTPSRQPGRFSSLWG